MRRSMGLAIMAIAVVCGNLAAQSDKAVLPEKMAGADGAVVTLKGTLVAGEVCSRDWKKEMASLPPGKAIILFAMDGTPDVNAAFVEIMKDLCDGKSIDSDQAAKIRDEFDKRLKYYVNLGALTDSKQTSGIKSVTGVITEKDGRKWITASRIEASTFAYPKGMLSPDKPLQEAGKDPLMLKASDALSLKCILLPAGKFMMGAPFYMAPRWNDEPPHLVTITRPFYLSETPVTQEMYESIMASNPSTLKDPKRPVRNVVCADILKFCQALSAKNGGRVVRLPTQAEWEYACRSGTSNPPFGEKFKDQDSKGPGRGESLPVKSKKPNGWGLYDMVGGWEMARDGKTPDLEDAVDPGIAAPDCGTGKKHIHLARGSSSHVSLFHGIGTGVAKDDTSFDSHKFRLLVEATPEEIAGLEKTEKK